MSISYDNKRDRITMNCNNYRKFSKYHICFSHYINYTKLEKTIYNKLRKLTGCFINDRKEFESIIKGECVNPKEDKLKKIDEINIKISDLRRKQDALYDDKFNNIISVETYSRLFKNTEDAINVLNNKLDRLNREVSNIKEEVNNLDIIDDFLNMKNPTKEIMNRLIDKIYVTKDKKLEIHYRIKKSEVLV